MPEVNADALIVAVKSMTLPGVTVSGVPLPKPGSVSQKYSTDTNCGLTNAFTEVIQTKPL